MPWAEPSARFTMLFEEVAIARLQGMTTAAITQRLGIGWDEADGIKQRHAAGAEPTDRRRDAISADDEKHVGHALWLTGVTRVGDGKTRDVFAAEGQGSPRR